MFLTTNVKGLILETKCHYACISKFSYISEKCIPHPGTTQSTPETTDWASWSTVTRGTGQVNLNNDQQIIK